MQAVSNAQIVEEEAKPRTPNMSTSSHAPPSPIIRLNVQQEDALAWLIEHLLSRNVRLRKGDLLITGKLGKIHVPVAGRYVVKYGSLSELTFSIIK